MTTSNQFYALKSPLGMLGQEHEQLPAQHVIIACESPFAGLPELILGTVVIIVGSAISILDRDHLSARLMRICIEACYDSVYRPN
jgi:hypothetical protein